MEVFRKVIGRCKKSTKRLFWWALGLSLVSSALSVLSNVLFGVLAEKFVGMQVGQRSTLVPVVEVLVLIFFVYILVAGIGYVIERCTDGFQLRALNELRILGYEKLQKLPIDYYSNTRPGTIVQRTTYVNQIVNWLRDLTDGRIYALAIPLFSLVPLFIYSWLIGVLTAIDIVCTVTIQMRKTRVRKPFMTAGNNAWDDAVGVFTEHVAHMATSRTSASQPALKKVFKDALTLQFGFRDKQYKIEQTHNSYQMLMEAVVIASVLMVTVLLAFKGDIGLAALVAITAMIRNIMMNSRSISWIYDSFVTATTEGQKYLDLLNEPEDSLDEHATKKVKGIQSLELNNVGFQYTDGENPVLGGISFRLSDNQTVAFVGESGGGKSTLSKLLTRLYRPTSGEFLVNGEPADTFYSDSLRQSIGVVMQDVALYHISIADNLRLALPKATDEQIIDALKLANAWEFVQALPNGMDTIVGERGVKLSGGQRQRIAIARAAIKKPSMIILDEATSALDTKSEREVQKGLEELLKNTKAVIIAHRLSTIKNADKIIVLDKGRIVEEGTYEQLKKKKGVFADLLAHQQL